MASRCDLITCPRPVRLKFLLSKVERAGHAVKRPDAIGRVFFDKGKYIVYTYLVKLLSSADIYPSQLLVHPSLSRRTENGVRRGEVFSCITMNESTSWESSRQDRRQGGLS